MAGFVAGENGLGLEEIWAPEEGGEKPGTFGRWLLIFCIYGKWGKKKKWKGREEKVDGRPLRGWGVVRVCMVRAGVFQSFG